MKRWTRTALSFATLALIPSLASAQSSSKSFDVCGGSYAGMSVLGLCAAVDVTVALVNNQPTVTMHVWNLSGSHAIAQESYGWSNIVGIGLINVIPASANVIGGSLKVTGPCFANPAGCDYSQYWAVGNNFGLYGLVIDMLAFGANGGGVVSRCDPTNDLYKRNPFLYSDCNRTSPNFVTMTFQTNQLFDLANGGDLFLKGQLDFSGEKTHCVTGTTNVDACVNIVASPEPGSMALLASGLAGFGGFGFFRRKRRKDEEA